MRIAPVNRRILAGLLVAAAVAASAAYPRPASRQTIKIAIHHSRFIPQDIEVAPGTDVTFVIRNDDPIDHEFILGDEQVQARHEDGTEPHHGALPGEVSVEAKSTASTRYEFERRGTLTFACHLPGHFAYGMKGVVRVG
jgi:uncharacterized cupredoxin-like copper-binding protein